MEEPNIDESMETEATQHWEQLEAAFEATVLPEKLCQFPTMNFYGFSESAPLALDVGRGESVE